MEHNRPTQEEIMRQRRRQAYLERQEKRATRKRRVTKFFLFLLIFILVFVFYEQGFDFSKFKFDFKKINFNFLKGNKDKKTNSSALGDNFIAYIPMDDRDIHTTRLIYLADSGGYELHFPDTKFYKTNIDAGENSYAGYSTKFGNPSKLAKFLLDEEEAGCDYYIISLDQLFSGGIAGSEYLDDEDFEVYGNAIKEAKKAFNTIIQKEENHVYLIDSVVGLNVIPGFMDFTKEDAQLLLQYTAQDRAELMGNDVTIEKISENYILKSDGTSIQTDLNLEKLNRYLSARERKLTYYDYVLKAISKSKNKSNIHIYYGIDGSGVASKNIQNNDLIYLRHAMSEYDVNAPIRVGLSSLSEMVFGELLLDTENRSYVAAVSYYGNKDQKVVNTDMTYPQAMEQLLKDMGIQTSGDADFHVLVYTGVKDPALQVKASEELLTQYLKNIKNHIPTVIINGAEYTTDRVLLEYLSNYEATSIPMGYLIGYSNWGGFNHSSRIAITEGITRSIYFANKNYSTTCDKGFLKVMGESFYEDISYLPTDKSSNELRTIEIRMEEMSKKITNNLQNSNYIAGISPYQEKGIKQIDTFNYSLPWSRVDEISFDVTATIGDAHNIKIPDKVVYKDPNEKEA